MTLVTVEVADLAAASRDMARTVGDPLSQLVGDALDGVRCGGGMAGDDPAAMQWSAGYDRAAPVAIQAAEDIINSCYRVSAMLAATARNYASAEAARRGSSTFELSSGGSGRTRTLLPATSSWRDHC